VKRKIIIVLAAVIMALSQIACGNMTGESRTIDSLQTLVDQQVLIGD
jgi:hypothetical protein